MSIDLISKNIKHFLGRITIEQVHHYNQNYWNEREQRCKQKLIHLPLLNALLPNIVLQAHLSYFGVIAELFDISNELPIDALMVKYRSLRKLHYGVTQIHDIGIIRVLALVNQIQDLKNNWMLQQLLHAHLVHNIE